MKYGDTPPLTPPHIYLNDEEGFPFEKVNRATPGCMYRLGVPVEINLHIDDEHVTLGYALELNPNNGSGVLHFGDRLHRLFTLVPEPVRQSIRDILATKYLEPLAEQRDTAAKFYASLVMAHVTIMELTR